MLSMAYSTAVGSTQGGNLFPEDDVTTIAYLLSSSSGWVALPSSANWSPISGVLPPLLLSQYSLSTSDLVVKEALGTTAEGGQGFLLRVWSEKDKRWDLLRGDSQ